MKSASGRWREEGKKTRQQRQMPCSSLISSPSSQVKEAEAEVILDVDAMEAVLQNASPYVIMDTALAMFGDNVSIAFSGAEDVALIELAHQTGRPFRVFSLDTGRLHPETYEYFQKVEEHYGIKIEYFFPDHERVEALVREKGMFSFFKDGHQECCSIRKVQPLRRALGEVRAWVTGQRKDQSPGTRASLPVVQRDGAFVGADGGPLVKFNPLMGLSSAAVWELLSAQSAPVNALHLRGFVSIGCEPCTRAVLPNQHEREGRWWWEDATAKECGLHKASKGVEGGEREGGAQSTSSSTAIRVDLPDLFQDPSVVALSRAHLEKLVEGDVEMRGEKAWLLVLYAPWCPFCQAMEASLLEVARSLHGSDVAVAKFRADLDDRQFCVENLQLKSFPTILFLPKVLQPSSEEPSVVKVKGSSARIEGGGRGVIKRISERRDVKSLLLWVEALR